MIDDITSEDLTSKTVEELASESREILALTLDLFGGTDAEMLGWLIRHIQLRTAGVAGAGAYEAGVRAGLNAGFHDAKRAGQLEGVEQGRAEAARTLEVLQGGRRGPSGLRVAERDELGRPTVILQEQSDGVVVRRSITRAESGHVESVVDEVVAGG